MDSTLINGDVKQTPAITVSKDGAGEEHNESEHVPRRRQRKPSITRNPEQLERRRKERRDSKVRFREEGGLTDSCPARTPARNDIPSREQILQQYRAACTKLKIKPLSRVTNFVASVNDLGSRHPELSLTGIRLDPRQCEALEEIFKWIQVETLLLDGCSLDDEGLMAIMEMMEFYEGTFRLIMPNNNRIQRPAWLAMSRMLKKSPFIHYLDVSQTATDLHAVPLLGRSLRVNCGLTTLHLEKNGISGARTVILAASLKVNTNLTHLYLGSNQLVGDDAAMLAAMLRCNKSLELLDLRDNNLQDRGVVMLCQALAEQGEGLKALILWSNRCTKESISPLCHMLAVHTTLHTIELGRNRLCHEGGMDTLKQGFLASRSLCNIGLMEVGLDVQGAVALAEYIAVSQQVQHLNVQRNDIRVGGLMALTRALRLSDTLIRLDVDRSVRTDHTQDKELVTSLMDSIAEYTFRNLQQATEVALRRQQEEARRQSQEEESAVAEEGEEASSAKADAVEEEKEHGEEESTSHSADHDDSVFANAAEPVSEEAVGAAIADVESNRTLDACLVNESTLSPTGSESAGGAERLESESSARAVEEDDQPSTPDEDSSSPPRNELFSPVADQSAVQFEEELAAALEELSPDQSPSHQLKKKESSPKQDSGTTDDNAESNKLQNNETNPESSNQPNTKSDLEEY